VSGAVGRIVLLVAEIPTTEGLKMTTAQRVLFDSLGLSTSDSDRLMATLDTTLDGSKWSQASYTQIVRTAQTLLKVGA
jgi:hypothetical protein